MARIRGALEIRREKYFEEEARIIAKVLQDGEQRKNFHRKRRVIHPTYFGTVHELRLLNLRTG